MSTIQASAPYLAMADAWRTMRDVMGGSQAIKKATTRYLPIPGQKTSTDPAVQEAINARYEDYRLRARFMPATARTAQTLLGGIFRLPAAVELPSQIEYMEENADGAGLSLDQFAQFACSELLTVGRGGVLVDYPPAPAGLSAEQVQALGLRAQMAWYKTEDILYWRTERVGAQTRLSLVVLRECVQDVVDDFKEDERTQYRVLVLRDGYYAQEVYSDKSELISQAFPTDYNGSRWTEIPFCFIGAVKNTPEPTLPVLFDMAQLNIGHYQNSADFEESAYVCGQVTPVVRTSQSKGEFDESNPDGLQLGSRKGIVVSADGSVEFLQAAPNLLPREAMKDKQEQMMQIGARLIVDAGGNETAEAARIRAGAEVSVLSTLVTNVSEAIEIALQYTCRFMGADEGKVSYSLNREFFPETLTAQDIQQLMALTVSGDIAQADLRAALRRGGYLSHERTDEMIEADVLAQGALMGDETEAPVNG